MPYETPNGCVYDSGDYARCLDMALELDRLRRDRGAARGRGGARASCSASGSARRSTRARTTSASRTLLNPELQFSGNNEVGDGQARHLRRGRRHARDGAAGPGARDDRRAGRRRHHRLLARRRARARRATTAYWNSHAGFSGTYASQFAVTGLGAVKGAAELLARRDDAARARSCCRRRRTTIELADGLRADQGRTREAALPFMALGAIVNANNAFLPPDFNPTLNHRFVYRPHFGMADTEKKFGNLTLTYATQIHACVVEVDPETGVVRDRRLRRRGRLRHADPPADRRGPGARRDGARDRRGDCTRTSPTTRTGTS